jgi:hypothetical protein
MTHKGIVTLVNGTIAKICEAKGIDPRPLAKGGKAELANGAFFLAYERVEGKILKLCGVEPAADAS